MKQFCSLSQDETGNLVRVEYKKNSFEFFLNRFTDYRM